MSTSRPTIRTAAPYGVAAALAGVAAVVFAAVMSAGLAAVNAGELDQAACEPNLTTTRFVDGGQLTAARFAIDAPCVDELVHDDGRPMQIQCKDTGGTMSELRDTQRDFAFTLEPTGTGPLQVRCQVAGELDGEAVSWQLASTVKTGGAAVR